MKFIDITVTDKGSINYMIPCSDRDMGNYCGNPMKGEGRGTGRKKSAKERMRKRRSE